MNVLAKCPECLKVTEFGADSPDRRLRCKWCGRLIKIPPPEELENAGRIITTDGGIIYIDENGRLYG